MVKFRGIYKSYCELQSFLNELGIKDFDDRFDFEIFLIIEEEVTETLKIIENFNTFEIVWDYAVKDVKSE